jgi:hypothetical protein
MNKNAAVIDRRYSLVDRRRIGFRAEDEFAKGRNGCNVCRVDVLLSCVFDSTVRCRKAIRGGNRIPFTGRVPGGSGCARTIH